MGTVRKTLNIIMHLGKKKTLGHATLFNCHGPSSIRENYNVPLCHVCSEIKKRCNENFPFHFHFLNFRWKTTFYEMPWNHEHVNYLFLRVLSNPISWWGRPPHWFLRRIRCFSKKWNISVRFSALKAWFKHVPSLKQNSCPEIETCKIYKHWWYSLTPVMQYSPWWYLQSQLLKIPGEISLPNCHYDTIIGIFTVNLFLFLCVDLQ